MQSDYYSEDLFGSKEHMAAQWIVHNLCYNIMSIENTPEPIKEVKVHAMKIKNKQHKYIMLAFLESEIPLMVKEKAPDLIMLDAYISGYCSQLLRGKSKIELNSLEEIISSDEKKFFSELINESDGEEKLELVIYYRLAVIVEEIILQYRD